MSVSCRICIVGGGIVGVATAYHLAARGEIDVILLEKAELTSGSTWHAAGNLPHFAGSHSAMRLHQMTKTLYSVLEEKHGDIGHHVTGSLRLAKTPDRLDEFQRICAMGNHLGIGMEMVSPADIQTRWPEIEISDLQGALWDPGDGNIDPASVTNAMAADARDAGISIRRNSPAIGIAQSPRGKWQVTIPDGEVEAEILVNAAGFRASEVAAMIGHSLPIASMEHQYLVTDEIAELKGRTEKLPLLRDPEHGFSYYLRQERDGVLIGPYEHEGKLWATDGVPSDFGQELLEPDLDRIADHVAKAMERVPLAAEAGIKTIVNGPITYTADGLPLIGPVHGIDNYFLNCGSSFGIVQGGGSGQLCAEWVLDGMPSIDPVGMDPRRFAKFATDDWVAARCKDLYDNEYAPSFPNEWAARAAGRPMRKTPNYTNHVDAGAVFYGQFGWERPAFYIHDGRPPQDAFSFRRPDWYADVAEECRAVAEDVGLLDLSPFSKFEVTGPGAESFCDGIGANRAPRRVGGAVLTHALSNSGTVLSELTITRIGETSFYVVSAAAAEHHDLDILNARLPEDGSVAIDNITADWGTLVLAGPRSRDLLSTLTNQDLGNEAFPWLTGREIVVGGISVRAIRMNFVGELGWELHHRMEDQAILHNLLTETGVEFGLAPFGMRAMDSLRLEKMYRGWRTELSTEFTLLEAGMDRFVRMDKEADFIGRAAIESERAADPNVCLVLLEIDAEGADCLGEEPVYDTDGNVAGLTTSGGYGHRLGKSLAFSYVKSAHARPGKTLCVSLLGDRRPAIVHMDALYDPQNKRLRA